MNGFVRIALIALGVLVAVATGMYFFNNRAKDYVNDLWADWTSKDDGCCKDSEVEFSHIAE